MLTSRTAIVTGLLGMDTAHPPPMAGDSGGETEIHPIWAMAVRVRDNSSNNNGAADETWAFMARNWGDEGFCADGTQWTLSTDTLSILIPWRPGAQKIDGLSGEFSIVNAPDSNLQNNVSVTYAGTSGLLLTFKLKSPPDEPDEDGTVTEGELQIHWSGTLVNNPLASAPRQTSGEQETGPEGAMRRLVGKMTPQQRTGFLAATAVKRIPKPSYHSSLGPPVQVTALPVRPKNAPAIRHVPSKRRAQAEKSRMDALHAIFGATIPGVAENKPGTAR
jgi:hypothetical protein